MPLTRGMLQELEQEAADHSTGCSSESPTISPGGARTPKSRTLGQLAFHIAVVPGSGRRVRCGAVSSNRPLQFGPGPAVRQAAAGS